VRRRTLPSIATITLLLALVAGCAESSGTAGPGRLAVVATTTVVADFARVVGGDLVAVTGLLKPNTDPHDYEPSAADSVAVSTADVIVSSGLGIDAWLDAVIHSAEPRARVTVASNGARIRPGDPHLWHDPRNAKVMVDNIAAAFETADKAHAGTYAANANAYTAQLDRLDTEIATRIDGLADKRLVTNHDAFGYYVDRFGMTYVGSVIPSFDSSAELSAEQVASLVSAIRDQRVRAVFSEHSLPPRAAAAIAKEAGVRVVAGDGALYGDGLGGPGSGAATYLEMMRHNTDAIVDNLS